LTLRRIPKSVAGRANDHYPRFDRHLIGATLFPL
jgi:hypothetical protein